MRTSPINLEDAQLLHRFRGGRVMLGLALLLVITLGSGCDRNAGQGVSLSEEGGVPVVWTTGGPRHSGALFRFESDLILGVDDGEPEWQLFSTPTFFLVAPNGCLVLGDLNRYRLFIVSPEGELLKAFGRRGAGPGEFLELGRLLWADYGREFLVQDRLLRRMSRFTMSGEYLGAIPYGQNPHTDSPTLALGNRRYIGTEATRQGEAWHIVYSVLDSSLTRSRQALESKYTADFSLTDERWFPIPFTARPGLSARPDGPVLHYEPQKGRVTRLSNELEPLQIVKWDSPAVQVSFADRARIRDQFFGSRDAERKRAADAIPFPKTYPPFVAVQVDGKGRIWAQHYVDALSDTANPSYVFDVLGSDGVWLGTQVMPFGPSLYSGSDYLIEREYVYHTYTAGLGALRLERLRIEESRPTGNGRRP